MDFKKILVISLILYVILAFISIEYGMPLPTSKIIKNLGKPSNIFAFNRTITFVTRNYFIIFSLKEWEDDVLVNESSYKCDLFDRVKIDKTLENIERKLPTLFFFRRSVPKLTNYSLFFSMESDKGFIAYIGLPILLGGIYNEEGRIIPLSTHVEMNKTALDDIKNYLTELGIECKEIANLCVLYRGYSYNMTECGDILYPHLCGEYFFDDGSYFVDCNGKYFFLPQPLKDAEVGDFIKFDSVRVENNTIISYQSFSRRYDCDYYCI